MHVLVIGLAKSGEAVTRLLLNRGVEVVVNERNERADGDSEIEALEALGASVICGSHPLSLLEPRPDFIVKNPGIPYTLPLIAEAVARGIAVYTEIEVASWLTTSPIYAITGSNGKTTTTTLVGEMLKSAHQNPVVAGNIGVVLSGVIDQVASEQPIVLEVSSFQLMGTEGFHPRVAALLNIYPAHLDYHGSIESYTAAKWRIFQNMSGRDTAVLNLDQPVLRDLAPDLQCEVAWFSRMQPVKNGVFIQAGIVTAHRYDELTPIINVKDIALKGEHNLENVLAAAAIAFWAGASVDAIRSVLLQFQGVEHRIEFVRQVNGVDFYNDSKATNPRAALSSLRSFPGNIVWIAGGLHRGDDFSVMVPDLQARVRAAVLLGESKDEIQQACLEAGIREVHQMQSLEEAIQLAYRLAQPGDVVLLSPACASWDMFQSFEVRGSMFKHVVHTL